VEQIWNKCAGGDGLRLSARGFREPLRKPLPEKGLGAPWMAQGDHGRQPKQRRERIENPCVGGSTPPLPTTTRRRKSFGLRRFLYSVLRHTDNGPEAVAQIWHK